MYKYPKCPTPPMGWNSYYTVNCSPTEELLIQAADLLCDLGLKDAGYEFVNLGDGWIEPERDKNGNLVARKESFPHGMKYITDYIHKKGLKAGTYLGAGLYTWNGDAGSLNHEYEDARQLAEWGFDYLKYDRHPMEEDPPRDTVAEYIKMGLAIRDCGRDIIYNLCEHGTTSPWLWAAPAGQLWRIGADIRDAWYSKTNNGCLGIMDIIDNYAEKTCAYGSVGCHNDPDMLICGMRKQNDWSGPGCNDIEYKSAFSLWCLLSAPLLIGKDLRKMDKATLEILTNPRLIQINQDQLCIPAKRVYHDANSHDIWVKQLDNVRWCVGIVNRAEQKQTLGFEMSQLHLTPAVTSKLTDAWTNEILCERLTTGEYATEVDSHETKVIFIDPIL